MTAPLLTRRIGDSNSEKTLSAAGVSPLFARLYAVRVIASAEDASFKLSLLPSPATMKSIRDVVDRLILAIKKQAST